MRRQKSRRRASSAALGGVSTLLAAVLLGALLGGALGCRGAAEERAELPRLEPLPAEVLAGVSPVVRSELEAKQARIRELGDADPLDRAALFDAWLDLGTAYVIYDLLDPAEAAFQAAGQVMPARPEAPYLLGYLRRVQGRVDEAAVLYEEVLAADPDFAPALLRRARLHLDGGAVDAAEPLLRRALELDADSAAAWEGLGQVAAARGDDRAAVAAWSRALELQPRATSLHYALGQAWQRMGDTARAEAALAAAGETPVTVDDPLLDELVGRADSAEFHRQEGAEAIQAKDWVAAVGGYERAIELDPNEPQDYLALALAREQLGDLPGAVSALRAGAAATSSASAERRAELLRYLGSTLQAAGRDAEAVDAFERSLALLPAQPEVHLALADARIRSRDWAGALAELDAVAALAEDEPGAGVLGRRGGVLMNLGRGEEALASYRRAAAAAPDDAEVRLQLAAALEHLGRTAEAARERARAAELARASGDAAGLAIAEGRRHQAARRFEEALAAYDRAVELAPERAAPRLLRGNLLGHLGRLDEAVADLAAAVAAEPEAREPRRSEIAALLLLGRYGEARVRLNEALRRFPLDRELARISARLLAAAPDPRVRDAALALRQAEAIYRASPDPAATEILAMAAAAAGEHQRAAELQGEVVASLAAGGEGALVEAMRQRLGLYQRGEAWQAARPEEILGSPLEPRGEPRGDGSGGRG